MEIIIQHTFAIFICTIYMERTQHSSVAFLSVAICYPKRPVSATSNTSLSQSLLYYGTTLMLLRVSYSLSLFFYAFFYAATQNKLYVCVCMCVCVIIPLLHP